jgi:hypothetical protein
MKTFILRSTTVRAEGEVWAQTEFTTRPDGRVEVHEFDEDGNCQTITITSKEEARDLYRSYLKSGWIRIS